MILGSKIRGWHSARTVLQNLHLLFLFICLFGICLHELTLVTVAWDRGSLSLKWRNWRTQAKSHIWISGVERMYYLRSWPREDTPIPQVCEVRYQAKYHIPFKEIKCAPALISRKTKPLKIHWRKIPLKRGWWTTYRKYLSEPVKRTLVASKWPPMVRVGKQHINLSVIRGLWATLTCVPPWSLPLNVRKCMCTEPTGRVCFPAGQFICSSMTSGNSQPLCLHFLVINWSRHFTHLPTVS